MIGAVGILGCGGGGSSSPDPVLKDLEASSTPNPVTGAFGVDKDPAKQRWDYTVVLKNNLDEAVTVESCQGTVTGEVPAFSSSWGPKGWAGVVIAPKGTYTYRGETKATADITKGKEVRTWHAKSASGKVITETYTIELR